MKFRRKAIKIQGTVLHVTEGAGTLLGQGVVHCKDKYGLSHFFVSRISDYKSGDEVVMTIRKA